MLLAVLVASCSTTAVDEAPPHRSSQSHPIAQSEVSGRVGPVDWVFEAEWTEGNPVALATRPLDHSAYQVGSPRPAEKDDVVTDGRGGSKLDPQLDGLVADAERTGRTSERIDVVVTFRDDVRMPRFPDPEESEARDSPRNINAAVEARRLVDGIRAVRASGYARLTQELQHEFGVVVRDVFWIINGISATLPLGSVRLLAERGDVQYIELKNTNIPPPAGQSSDARFVMMTDPYFNLGLQGGWFGLLDTGVRRTHTLLTNLSWYRDCVNGGTDCTNSGPPYNLYYNPDDDCWDHGTKAMSELTANTNLGNPNRGVTGIYVDSWKIYGNGCGDLDTAAAVKAFEAAIPALDRVIVAQIQGFGNEDSAIAAAADHAYEHGAVVIAANGNTGPFAGSVRCPANARKVIGVGAADVTSLVLNNNSGRGPTKDGRTKPDVLGPTNVSAASITSNTAMATFANTSGATPNVAGAAGLLRNFLRGSNFEWDPGLVYALLINSGRSGNYSAVDNSNGGGMVTLPVNGKFWVGAVTAATAPGSKVYVPITLANITTQTLTATLWWPQSIGEARNDVDLYILNPGGNTHSYSIGTGVFEKARVESGSLTNGTWTIEISSWNVKKPQTVYYAVSVLY